MEISIGPYDARFEAWRPGDGQVFASDFAFDTETTPIDPDRDWLPQTYILGAAYDGSRGFFVQREHVAEFFRVHADLHAVFHHAPFDLAVIHLLAPELDIYGWVDRHQVWDTQILHRLLKLAEVGHTARGPGQSSLETCAREYLGVELPKSIKDSDGDDVRLSYSKWLHRPAEEIEVVYLEYLARDVISTAWVYDALIRRLDEVLYGGQHVWGYVDEGWLTGRIRQWGPQTHHVQLNAAIVLRAITANGLHVDLEQRDQLTAHLAAVAEEHRRELRAMGYLPGQPGSNKALQEILRDLERQHQDVAFPRTPTGKYETRRESLEDLAEIEPFIRTFLEFKSVEKLRSSFLGKMSSRCLHPSFDPLMVTGRTSSYGAVNAQNLPRDDRVRSCFVPSPGHVFLDADYATVEMATLAQSVQSQLGIPSMMAEAINQDRDLHRLVAARFTGKPESEVTFAERSKAKAINFGTPGGMGEDGLRRYAKASYGVDLSVDEVRQFLNSWFDLFQEMKAFLAREGDLGEDLARHFELTPLTYFEVTGSHEWLDRDCGQGAVSNEILGWMFRKVLLEADPQTRNQKPYSNDLVDFCWQRAAERIADFSKADQANISLRRPSKRLARAASQIAEHKGCFTLTARLRASASFCARHNTLFQGLAADGAKIALWRLWRAGYRIVNFIHDEVLIEVPADSDLKQHADEVRRIMIEAMREVVPDVQIKVACAASDRWYKAAEAVYDPIDGRLLLWTPPATQPTPEVPDGGPNNLGAPAALVAT